MALFPLPKQTMDNVSRNGARLAAECEMAREEALAQRIADLVVEKVVAAERRRAKLTKGLDDGR